MKRKIALLIFMILALSLALAACNQTAKTNIETRWEAETHVFKISLADFMENSNVFNEYINAGTESGAYYKDIAFSNEFANWDELKPVAVNGSYTLTITPPAYLTGQCTVETTQEMCVEYNLADIRSTGELMSAKATAEQLEKYGMTNDNENTVILWSSTQTSVVFDNTPSQNPLSSRVKVEGFYAGKVAQQLSSYEVETSYNYDNKRPVATIKLTTAEGENTSEYKFAKNSAGNFIDSSQVLMYVRSLDKSSSSFQDSPSKLVFNPYTQSLQTASFAPSYVGTTPKLLRNVILTDTTRDNNILATSLNVVAIKIGNNSFMMQENLPDRLASKNLDVCSTADGMESKFTTVRFRVGYLAYEIDYTNPANTSNWSAILQALPATTEE